jgi:hypothetical protein
MPKGADPMSNLFAVQAPSKLVQFYNYHQNVGFVSVK